MRKKTCSLALLLVLAMGQTAHADWFSDLTDNLHTNSPTAWEGQKRGYFTGGGFNLRTQTSREPLLTVQAPRLEADLEKRPALSHLKKRMIIKSSFG